MPRESEKVAISATGASVQGEMDHHFGRCRYFVMAEEGRTYAVENTARDAPEGAGVKAAQLMIDNKVDAVITGSLGPKASEVLKEAGIRSYVGASGRIEDVLERYRQERLEPPSGAGNDTNMNRKN